MILAPPSIMIYSIPLLCMLLHVGISTTVASDGKVNPLGIASTSYLRGSLGESNNGLLPARSKTSISSRLMGIIKYNGEDITDDYSPTPVAIPLHVHLSDTPRILEHVNRFEQAVIGFISASMPKDGFGEFMSASVLEQRLIWEEDTSSICLKVYFKVDAFVSNDIDRNKLKRATQKLLNTRSDIFQEYYLYKSSKDIADNDEAQSIAMNLSFRPPISFAAVAFGLCGIAGSIGYLYWKTTVNQPTVNDETKSNHNHDPTEINSKPTLETSESFANDSYLDHSLTFPMQYHEKQPEEWDDISGPDDLTDDGSFNASVVFCPSVLQRGNELSVIRANIEDNTDSDSSNEDDSSVVKFRSPPLSPEALQEFDMALRQAEF